MRAASSGLVTMPTACLAKSLRGPRLQHFSTKIFNHEIDLQYHPVKKFQRNVFFHKRDEVKIR